MVDITYTDSHNHEKVIQVESIDAYNIKEKIRFISLNESDSLIISATEFSKTSTHENTINIELTKNEFNRIIELVKTKF